MADFEKHLSVFASDGRIYQVEYAFKAVTSVGINTVAVRGKDSVAFCTQKKVPETLVDPSSVTQLFKITDKIGACMTGLPTDSREIATTLRKEAYDFKFDFGYDVPVDILAQRLGNQHQSFTQNAGMRIRAVITFLIGIDEEKGPQLYKIDPAGSVTGYSACFAGPKDQEGMNHLEKQMKQKPEPTKNESIQLTISALQHVLSADFKATDLEVGVVSSDNVEFQKLTAEQIEEHLNILHDRD
eukprot:CAMPEP_0115019196 /NCGR_PEP_ID=MMETSP0216-20121206/29289_1 /TAXON_ID=223996 /ORGANISM="Protocruzia adherens, Strain Boccale" /LENGTH=241 /DNA_ID=CAMNT_0002390599 /DNA_START=9 /DNA_END=734 /DNA_ORIENTATION=-